MPPFPSTLPSPPPTGPSCLDQSRQYATRAHLGPRPRDRTPTPPPILLPSTEYLELSKPTPPLKGDHVIPKLLVLDLNGALVYRNRSSADRRRSSPRPYLQSFLEYVFLPDADAGPSVRRPWEVFVWSSAQPHNVRGMVEGALGTRWSEGIWNEETSRSKAAREGGEGRLLGVWARDKMGLAASDYTRKVQTTKDLRKVLDHLQSFRSSASDSVPHFDEKTIMLLDDSPLKAVHQPFNQLVIPEFGHKEHIDSKKAVMALESAANGDISASGSLDQTLLAVVGVLDELREVSNVPAWMRAGGLRLDEMMDEDVTLETLPSHADFSHWYQDPTILRHWVEAGRSALQRRGIEIRHGIEADSNVVPSQGSSPSRPQMRSPLWKREASYSPSRPTSPTYRQNLSGSGPRDGSPRRRDYSTTIKVDDDELPDDNNDTVNTAPGLTAAQTPPKPQSSSVTTPAERLLPADLARHLDRIIDNYGNLSVNQKNQLRSASTILSKIPADPCSTAPAQIPKANGKAKGKAKAENGSEQPGEPSYSALTAASGAGVGAGASAGTSTAAAAATTAPSTTGGGSASGGSSGKKKARFEAEFAAAKKLNGQLSKQTFRAQRHLELTRYQDEMRAAKQARKEQNIARQAKQKAVKDKRWSKGSGQGKGK
ncbi:hypothetical protein I317_01080 [Kwoniella heveanensis CBS 569]|nr:hypothetical protein I317_01080 [Kwoniella heveanensis CBS 569]